MSQNNIYSAHYFSKLNVVLHIILTDQCFPPPEFFPAIHMCHFLNCSLGEETILSVYCIMYRATCSNLINLSLFTV